MTPADAKTGADDIGAPPLCAYHRMVIANLAAKDHVNDRDSDRAATLIARQCCTRRSLR